MKKSVTNWNNYPVRQAELIHVRTVQEAVSKAAKSFVIARGLGRCYGDSSLAENIISTTQFNHLLSFDDQTGVLKCQSGVSLKDLLDTFVKRGWFLPVTPGTKYVTVGGAVASDVHGKNHHMEGSFSRHVLSLTIYTPAKGLTDCSPTENSDLFWATCGGMGLTGLILTVTFKLKRISSAFISQKQVKAKNLDTILNLFEENKGYTYSMAWIDCLKTGKNFGRSILIVGEHAPIDALSRKARKEPLTLPGKLELTIPFNLPSFALNKFSIKAFNMLYYGKNFKEVINNIVPYEGFFYPLDSILHWNRMYGKRGFVQYQFVLPMATGKKGLTEILHRINKNGMGSFLAVLKQFGFQDDLISFPMAGYTLALDFPIQKGLFKFLDELDKVVLDFGGRLYLSKDSRMKPEILSKGYSKYYRFVDVVKQYNPEFSFRSDQSDRLLITQL